MEKKILLIDDDSGMRNMLRVYLEKKGYSVTTADNGENGIDCINAEVFPIIITDLKMPGKDGIEVLKAARKKNRKIKVVIITAYASVETAVKALKLGASEYVVKPFQDLERDVGRIIDRLYRGMILFIENQKLISDLQQRQKQIDQQLEMAMHIQRSLLPLNPQIEGLDIGIFRNVHEQISGDFFDLIPYGENSYGFTIGKVLGRDVPAALLMSAIFGTARSILRDRIMPEEFFDIANTAVYNILSKGYGNFVSLLYGLLDVDSRTLYAASAGKMRVMLFRENNQEYQASILNTTGNFLGRFKDTSFSQQEVKIRRFDRIVLVTNQVFELKNPNDEQFGLERTEHFFLRQQGVSPQRAASEFGERLMAHAAEGESLDLSALVIDIR